MTERAGVPAILLGTWRAVHATDTGKDLEIWWHAADTQCVFEDMQRDAADWEAWLLVMREAWYARHPDTLKPAEHSHG